MKRCSKCKELKEETNFCKDRSRRDGLQLWCKECKSDHHKNRDSKYMKKYRESYYQQNKEKIKSKSKNFYDLNKDWISENKKNNYEKNKESYLLSNKIYRENNKEKIRERRKEYNYAPISFYSDSNVRKEIELYEKIKKSEDNFLMCKCAYCGEWFKPTYLDIRNRIITINGKYNHRGESKLYCSQQCKDSCPTYNQKLYPKDFKPATSREVQPQLRQMVFERNNYKCQRCSKHKDELDVGLHCHHILPLNEDPIQSADVDTCITLCETCHKWVHQNIDGCGYGEMRC